MKKKSKKQKVQEVSDVLDKKNIKVLISKILKDKNNEYARLAITYPLELFPDFDDVIESSIGRSKDSGAGFGQRDLDYYPKSNKDCENMFKKVVSSLKKEGYRVFLFKGTETGYTETLL